MEITLRRATMDDYHGMCILLDETDAFHARALPHIFRHVKKARSREFVESVLIDEDAIVVVAELEGQLIGLVHAAIRGTPDIPAIIPRRYAHVGDVIVTEKSRHSSVGRLLVREVEAWARRKGLISVELNVCDFNKDALAFYEELGYHAASHNMSKEL